MRRRRLRRHRVRYRLRDVPWGRDGLNGRENELDRFVGESRSIKDHELNTFIARSGDVPTTSETLFIFIHYNQTSLRKGSTFCSFFRLHVSPAQ